MSPTTTAKRTPWIVQLQRTRWVNALVKKLHLHDAVDLVLSRVPLRQSTPAKFVYEIRSVASLIAAKEIFETDLYRGPLRHQSIQTFVDLGCNVGYFPVLLADLAGSRRIEGLAIDGNAAVVSETKRHLEINRLDRVHAIEGLAGFPDGVKDANFLINPSHIASTATGKLNPNVPSAGRSTEVRVPCVDVLQEWKSRFGDRRIDVLKVDIEGMELSFFQNSPELLQLSDRIIFEWHKWQVSIEECTEALNRLGFKHLHILWEDPDLGMASATR